MKTFYQNMTVFLFLVFGLGFYAIGQGNILPPELIGADLEKVQTDLKKAIEAGQDSLTINLAEVYFFEGKYQEALQTYQKADSLGLVTTAEQKRNYTHAARKLNTSSPYDTPTGYFNQSWTFDANLQTFCGNSANEDFAPFKWNDLLFVTSSRNASRRIYDYTSKPFLDVFAFTGDCEPVSLPRFLPRDLNTRLHDGPIAISADTNLVVITRNYEKPNENGFHNLYMEYFVRENGDWQKGIKFPFANENYSVQHPFYHDGESTLYFASNFRGGQGGFDLYKAKWNGIDWETPVNLGPVVNSSYDEVFPSFTLEGDLVYSTNHIETMGGLDLVLFKDGLRTLFPEPFNTANDDFALIFENANQGYLSSNRTGGTFGDNIYTFEIPIPAPVEYFFIAKVVDKETGDPIEGALVAFSSYGRSISGSVLTDNTGEANMFKSVADVPEFQFDISKPEYNTLEMITSAFEISGTHYKITFSLEKRTEPIVAEVPKPTSGTIILYFENDVPAAVQGGLSAIRGYDQTHRNFLEARSTYRQQTVSSQEDLNAFFTDVEGGMQELDQFARFLFEELKNGEKFLIDLAAYASPLASNEYNVRLSERRNASVKNFLNQWQNGALTTYLADGSLRFVDKAYGDSQAPAGISDSPANRSESVYSVKASRERRVAMFWKKVTEETGDVLQNETTNPKDYYIVVGSFRNKRSAETVMNQVSRQGAPAPGILEEQEKGLFRVYFNRYPMLEQARTELPQVRQTITSDAWIVSL
ncbi:MAG: SPOR domain-containing protein [Bacteroides sp.]|jgi:hypothetical protein|nr:SPOR domain-containing protein [Bacteroides sp.]